MAAGGSNLQGNAGNINYNSRAGIILANRKARDPAHIITAEVAWGQQY